MTEMENLTGWLNCNVKMRFSLSAAPAADFDTPDRARRGAALRAGRAPGRGQRGLPPER